MRKRVAGVRAVVKASAASLLALAAAGVACNGLFGIQDGTLGASDGGGDDVAVGGETGADGAVADSANPDGDAGSNGDVALEAAPDGPQYAAPVETPVSATDAGGPFLVRTSPAIALGGGNAVVTFDDFDNPNTSLHLDSWSRSINGGVSFTDLGQFPDPPPDGGVSDVGYPSIARDAVNGNVYIATNGALATAGAYNELAFLVSTNGGATFAPAVNAADPALTSSDFVDITSVVVDNASGSGQGVVYAAYGVYGASVDVRLTTYSGGAFTHTTAIDLGAGNLASLPWAAVGPNHYLYVVYYSVTGTNPAIGVVRSRNQGATFDPAVTIAPLHMPFVAGDVNGNLGLVGVGTDGGPTPVGLYSAPQIVANPVSGALYVSFADSTQGADKANVYFTHSEDSGLTWAAPVKVNDDATTNDQFLPAIAVTPDGTRLAIDFYDRRNDAANLAADRYAATATIAGTSVTFRPNFRISPTSFPLLIAAQGGSTGFFSIHTSMAADATYFYDVFSDENVAQKNLDVKLARYGVLH